MQTADADRQRGGRLARRGNGAYFVYKTLITQYFCRVPQGRIDNSQGLQPLVSSRNGSRVPQGRKKCVPWMPPIWPLLASQVPYYEGSTSIPSPLVKEPTGRKPVQKSKTFCHVCHVPCPMHFRTQVELHRPGEDHDVFPAPRLSHHPTSRLTRIRYVAPNDLPDGMDHICIVRSAFLNWTSPHNMCSSEHLHDQEIHSNNSKRSNGHLPRGLSLQSTEV